MGRMQSNGRMAIHSYGRMAMHSYGRMAMRPYINPPSLL